MTIDDLVKRDSRIAGNKRESEGTMRHLTHWIAHKVGCNSETVVMWWEQPKKEQPKKLMTGYRCDGCGKVRDARERAQVRCFDRNGCPADGEVVMGKPKP
jgi:DNA gyrase inhibitor GyrI